MGMLFGSGRKIGNAAPDCGRWCSTPSRRWFRQPGIYLAALIGFALPMLVLLALLTAHARTGLLTRFFTAAPPTWDQTQDPFDFSPMLEILTKRGDLQGVDLIATRNRITAGLMSTGLQGNWPIRVLSEPIHQFFFLQGETGTRAVLFLDPQASALEPISLNRGDVPYITVNLIWLRYRE